MKRWEMVVEALVITELDARMVCKEWDENPDDEMPAAAPAPDLGRDIAAAHIVTAFKGDAEWCAMLMDVWERLTGRVKEGE